MSTKHMNLAAALIAAQQAFGDVTKGRTVRVETAKGKFSYTYADLGSVLDAITPALHENGLVISQCMDVKDGQPVIHTVMMHADSDDDLHSYTPIVWADKTDPQKFGGGITYSRRYALMAMCNLNAEDDDGQHARQPAPKRERVPDNVNPVSGEIQEAIPVPDEGAKLNLIRRINRAGGLLGKTEDEMKESMRKVYARDTPIEQFSRKSLSVDQLQQYLDLAEKTVGQQRTVEVVQ